MSNANTHDIRVLNGLTRAAIDSSNGYSRAARETTVPALSSLYEALAVERRRVATELQGAVRSLGGSPENSGSILAKARRAFSDVTHALLRDEEAVIDPAEAGDEAMRQRFVQALGDNRIAAETRETLRRLGDSLKLDEMRLRDLQRTLHEQTSAEHALFPS